GHPGGSESLPCPRSCCRASSRARDCPALVAGQSSVLQTPSVEVPAVTLPLHLKDLRLAWEARDPELVSLVEALAVQPDPPPDKPIRQGAPTFQRFLAEIRGWAFRH